jgi:hypothetical protein
VEDKAYVFAEILEWDKERPLGRCVREGKRRYCRQSNPWGHDIYAYEGLASGALVRYIWRKRASETSF